MGEDSHVEVKTVQVVTQQDRRTLHKGAEIELRRWARIQPPQVLARDRWPRVLARQNDRLHTREDFTGQFCPKPQPGTPGERLEEGCLPPLAGRVSASDT